MLWTPDIDVEVYRAYRASRNAPLVKQGAILKAIKQVLILNDRSESAVDKLVSIYESSGGSGESTCLPMIGPTRCGKTTVAKLFYLLIKHEKKPLKQPVIYVQVPAKQAVSAISAAMLTAFQDPAPTQGSPSERIDRIKLYVDTQEVRLVIFDEVQHLVKRENDHINHESADWIKMLMNCLPCGFVLAGTDRVARIFNANDQLCGRIEGASAFMTAWDSNNPDDFENARDYYAKWDAKLMGIANFAASGLAEDELLARILLASAGWPGAGAKLIHSASRHALSKGNSRIEWEDFAHAFGVMQVLTKLTGPNPCEFRFNPATDSDLKPAGIPI
jgi:hypothetical protein